MRATYADDICTIAEIDRICELIIGKLQLLSQYDADNIILPTLTDGDVVEANEDVVPEIVDQKNRRDGSSSNIEDLVQIPNRTSSQIDSVELDYTLIPDEQDSIIADFHMLDDWCQPVNENDNSTKVRTQIFNRATNPGGTEPVMLIGEHRVLYHDSEEYYSMSSDDDWRHSYNPHFDSLVLDECPFEPHIDNEEYILSNSDYLITYNSDGEDIVYSTDTDCDTDFADDTDCADDYEDDYEDEEIFYSSEEDDFCYEEIVYPSDDEDNFCYEDGEILYPNDEDDYCYEDEEMLEGYQYNLLARDYNAEEGDEEPLLENEDEELEISIEKEDYVVNEGDGVSLMENVDEEVKIDDYVVDGIIVCDIGEELLTGETGREDYISGDDDIYFRPMRDPINEDEDDFLDRMERGEYYEDEEEELSDVEETSDTYIKNLENENVKGSTWRVERERQANYSTTNTYTRFKYTKLVKVDPWETSPRSNTIGQPPAIIRIAQAFRNWIEIITNEPTMCSTSTCCISYVV